MSLPPILQSSNHKYQWIEAFIEASHLIWMTIGRMMTLMIIQPIMSTVITTSLMIITMITRAQTMIMISHQKKEVDSGKKTGARMVDTTTLSAAPPSSSPKSRATPVSTKTDQTVLVGEVSCQCCKEFKTPSQGTS